MRATRWLETSLGDVVQDTQYGTSTRANEEGNGIPVLRMNNITYEGALDLAQLKHVELQEKEVERYTVRRGDLLFNRTNSQELVGKTAVWDRDEPFAFAGYLIRLRVDRKRADPAFVAAWFNTRQMKTLLRTRAKPSINMANINATEVLKFPVPLPPLDEQRRIAEVLDRAEALRAKRRAALAQLDTLTQSIFLDLFGDPGTVGGWPVRTLGSLCAPGDSINYGVVQPGEHSEGGVPLIRVGDLQEGAVNHASLKRISPQIEEAYRRSRLVGDEILVSCVGSIGVVALVDASARGFNIARAVARIRLAEEINRVFVAEFLKSSPVQQYFKNELRTVSQPTLNIKQLAETAVTLPPKALQITFAERVAAVEKLKSAQRRSLAELDALFASLQHRAFRGEL